jgi:hypothetical protein
MRSRHPGPAFNSEWDIARPPLGLAVQIKRGLGQGSPSHFACLLGVLSIERTTDDAMTLESP